MRIHKVKVCETELLSGKAYCVGTSLSGLGVYEVLSVVLTAALSGSCCYSTRFSEEETEVTRAQVVSRREIQAGRLQS